MNNYERASKEFSKMLRICYLTEQYKIAYNCDFSEGFARAIRAFVNEDFNEDLNKIEERLYNYHQLKDYSKLDKGTQLIVSASCDFINSKMRCKQV